MEVVSMNIIGLIIGALIGALFSGLIIWLIGKLGWGLEVDGFKPAYLAAILIALFNAFANWLWGVLNYTPEGGWLGAVTHLLIAAVFLLAAGQIIKGLRVKGWGGALLAAVIMAAVGWLITWGITSLV